MSQAVVHNGIVYLSGQIDGTADDIKGQTKNVISSRGWNRQTKINIDYMVEGYRERFRIND